MLGLRGKLDLRERLDEGLLVGDGATGTLLAGRGVEHPLDRVALTHPQAIKNPHEEYLRAGTRIPETNTYAANTIRLEARNLADEAREINIAGARLAREVAQKLLVEAKLLINGVYLMPPASMPYLAGDVAEAIS